MRLWVEFVAEELTDDDPLAVHVPLELPEKVYSIGQAAQHYADAIGYCLAQGFAETKESDRIASLPITRRYPADIYLPVGEAILGLVEGPCQLVVNRHYKIFAFKRFAPR